MFIEIQDRTPELIEQLVALWEGSVKATHHFLSDAEIAAIKPYVPQGLTAIPHLVIAKEGENPTAFMGIAEGKLEMLFVAADQRGKGIGKALLQKGIRDYGVRELAVNEQNPQARDFYQHLGFEVYQRNELDEQGNPYPILLMRLKSG